MLAKLLVETLEANDLDALVYPTLRVKPVLVGERPVRQHVPPVRPLGAAGHLVAGRVHGRRRCRLVWNCWRDHTQTVD